MSSFDLSILIVSYNVRDYLLACIASIKKNTTGIAYEIIIVDNNSSDNSADAVAQAYPYVKLIRNTENLGFARANNQAYEKSTGEYVLLLNPDTEVKPGAIETVLEFMEKEQSAGVCGCRIIESDGTVQRSIHSFPTLGRNLAKALLLDRVLLTNSCSSYTPEKPAISVDYIGGAFMMVRRKALGPDVLLNTDYFMYSEEKDLSFRLLKSGWKTWFVPKATIVHHGQKSTAQTSRPMFLEVQKSQIKFYRNFHSPLHAALLSVSWWLVLVSGMLQSLAAVPIDKGKRLFPFICAVMAFPWYMVALLNRKSRSV